MNFLFFIFLICGTALLPLLYFLTKTVQTLFLSRQRKRRSIEAKARILHVQVLNGPCRTVPFVSLKVEVFARDGEPFVADAEGFFRHDEAVCLQPGGIIWTRYLPCNKTQLQVIKKPVTPKEERKLFVRDSGEIIAVKTSSTQSPAARHRRLVFR